MTLVDIYGTAKKGTIDELQRNGINVASTAPVGHYDLLIMPVHCPDHFIGRSTFERRITYHEAIGELVNFQYPVIEVTGANAKTSTCQVISVLLAGQGLSVLMLTSRGVEGMRPGCHKIIERTASIAPPTLVGLSKMNEKFDIGVFEMSLGGCGIGKVSVITTIGDNYPIASGTRKAFDGKVQMIKLAKNAVVFPEAERNVWEPYVKKNVKVVTVRSGRGCQRDTPR